MRSRFSYATSLPKQGRNPLARYQAGLRTEARIIEATRGLGEVGLEGTTLKAICEQASVQAGSFYNIFASKEEVIVRVVSEAIAAVAPEADAQADVSDLVEAYIQFVTSDPTLAAVYTEIAISGALNNGPMRERIARHHRQRLDIFSAAVRRSVPEISPNDAVTRAELLLAALHGLGFHLTLEPDFDFTGHARRVAAFTVS